MKYVIVESPVGMPWSMIFPETTRDEIIIRSVKDRTIVSAGFAKYVFQNNKVIGVNCWGELLGFKSREEDAKIVINFILTSE